MMMMMMMMTTIALRSPYWVYNIYQYFNVLMAYCLGRLKSVISNDNSPIPSLLKPLSKRSPVQSPSVENELNLHVNGISFWYEWMGIETCLVKEAKGKFGNGLLKVWKCILEPLHHWNFQVFQNQKPQVNQREPIQQVLKSLWHLPAISLRFMLYTILMFT